VLLAYLNRGLVKHNTSSGLIAGATGPIATKLTSYHRAPRARIINELFSNMRAQADELPSQLALQQVLSAIVVHSSYQQALDHQFQK
jgi:hypothetical protein